VTEGNRADASPINREIALLSVAFMVIFGAYNGATQYVTTYFTQLGAPRTGFISLILIYASFALGNLTAGTVVKRYGTRSCMKLGASFYILYLLGLAAESIPLVLAGSLLLGLGAALLWTGQSTHLNRTAPPDRRGASAGFFSTLITLGSALGSLALGFSITSRSYQLSFLLASVVPAAGLALIWRLKENQTEVPNTGADLDMRGVGAVLKSPTAWRLSSIWFTSAFFLGLTIGVIPISIKQYMGVSAIGLLSAVIFIAPVAFSYTTGRVSDSKGRKATLTASFLIGLTGAGTLWLAHSAPPLTIGVVLVAISSAMLFPLILALVGDVSTPSNLERLAAFFLLVSSTGTVVALVTSALATGAVIYLISVAALALLFVILFPVLRLDWSELGRRISSEIN
jgi:MFS family permease